LHDKYGKPIRAAKKVKKEYSVAEDPPVALVEEEQVEAPQPVQAAVLPLPVQAVKQEKDLLPNPLMLLLLALLLLLLLVKRRARERQ
jgi:hypothetical protein